MDMDRDPSAAATSGLPLFESTHRVDFIAERVQAAAGDIRRLTGSDEGAPAPDDVALAIVLPLLETLDWDVDDPRRVVPRFVTEAGVVDYALCHPADTPLCLVKVGPLPPGRGSGTVTDAETHPFTDLTQRAIQLGVAEHGREWRLHYPAPGRPLDGRVFARADLVEDEPRKVAKLLDQYLGYAVLRAGGAFKAAEAVYRRDAFPAYSCRAWRRTVASPGVLKRFESDMADISGVSPDPDEAQAYIHEQLEALPWTPSPPDPRSGREVTVGDKVWLYNFASGDLECRYVVATNPDLEEDLVTANSPLGRALLGAREGEVRETYLPDRRETRWKVRIVLVKAGQPD